jgi:hypothetical protein
LSRVLAVTTSMGTKWEAYSQAHLRLLVPEWERLIVDGTRNWSPTRFIESVVDEDVDYVVHVDEDCFVQSREPLLKLIAAFEHDQSLVAAGIPDGGCYYRNHNPAALNLFFVMFRADALRKAWKDREHWSSYRFRSEFSHEVMRQCQNLDRDRINWDEAEPYYPLFWSLLSQGGRFLYLSEELYKPRWSSRVLLPSGELLAEHMWYLRQWFSREAMPGHDCPNADRYDRFVNEWRDNYGGALKSNIVLFVMHARRFARRFVRLFRG